MASKEDFEAAFGLQVSDKSDLRDLLMAATCSIKKDTDGMKAGMEKMKENLNEVKEYVDDHEKKLDDLDTRLYKVQQSLTDYDLISQVERAKCVVVFYPVIWKDDRRHMRRTMEGILRDFRMPEELATRYGTARIFQTNTGKANKKVQMEFESPYIAKQVMQWTRGANAWVGKGPRINTEIKIAEAHYDKSNAIEKAGAEMRAYARANNIELKTETRYVLHDLVLFGRIDDNPPYAMDHEQEPSVAIQMLEEKTRRNRAWRSAPRRQSTSSFSASGKRKNEGDVLNEVETPGSISSTDLDSDSDWREGFLTSNSREQIKSKGRTERIFMATRKHRTPKRSPETKKSVVVLARTEEDNEPDVNNVFLSVDGVNDNNKQLSIPEQLSRQQNQSMLRRVREDTGNKIRVVVLDTEINENTNIKKAELRFQREVPYNEKQGKDIDLMTGKPKSLTIELHPVYVQALKHILTTQLIIGWKGEISSGKLRVEDVVLHVDKRGKHHDHKLTMIAETENDRNTVGVHLYYTTYNLHLQGLGAETVWRETIKVMFDELLTKNERLKNMEQLSRKNPESAAKAAGGITPIHTLESDTEATTPTRPLSEMIGMEERQRQTTPTTTTRGATGTVRKTLTPGQRLCQICSRGKIHHWFQCRGCKKKGHGKCVPRDNLCVNCLASGKFKEVRQPKSRVTDLREVARALEQVERREQPGSSPATPRSSPPSEMNRTTRTGSPTYEITHEGWDGHMAESLDLEAPNQQLHQQSLRETVEDLRRDNPGTVAIIERDTVNRQSKGRRQKTKPPESEEEPWLFQQLRTENSMLREQLEYKSLAFENFKRAQAMQTAREINSMFPTDTGQRDSSTTVNVNNNLYLTAKKIETGDGLGDNLEGIRIDKDKVEITKKKSPVDSLKDGEDQPPPPEVFHSFLEERENNDEDEQLAMKLMNDAVRGNEEMKLTNTQEEREGLDDLDTLL